MKKNQYVEIKNPLPLKDQETGVNAMYGEHWTVDTSRPTVARELQRQGFEAIQHDPAGHYLRFLLPENAITFRALAAVLNPHQASNLPNGTSNGKKKPRKPSKVGEESTPEREIEDEDNSSVDSAETEPRKGPKSSKGDRDEGLDSKVQSAGKTL